MNPLYSIHLSSDTRCLFYRVCIDRDSTGEGGGKLQVLSGRLSERSDKIHMPALGLITQYKNLAEAVT